MKRRDFLRLSAAAAAAPLATRLWAAPGADARLLVVFLRGGCDGTHLLVPVSSDFYYEARPNIAVARSACLEIDASWGLHPAVRDTLYPFWKKGELAFVPFAGSGDLSRSHFSSQDTIELGVTAGQRRDYTSGFLNRLAARVGAARTIAFTGEVPLMLRGSARVANMSLGGMARPMRSLDEREAELVAAMYRDVPHLREVVAEGFAAKSEMMANLGGEMMAADREAQGPRSFERDARRIGRLMRGTYNLGFVDVGGWDTHLNQGGTPEPARYNYLNTRFTELGRGLAAIAEELGPAWRDTVVVVVTEFGRAMRENGNRGTEHGHGALYWLLGGAVRGGRIAGEQMKIERATLHQDRDLPVLNEYRALLGGLFAKMYGIDTGTVFAGAAPTDLNLV